MTAKGRPALGRSGLIKKLRYDHEDLLKEAVATHPEVSRRTLLEVWTWRCLHADEAAETYVAQGTIADAWGLTRRQVARADRALEAVGLMVRNGKGPKGAIRYRLLPQVTGYPRTVQTDPVMADIWADSFDTARREVETSGARATIQTRLLNRLDRLQRRVVEEWSRKDTAGGVTIPRNLTEWADEKAKEVVAEARCPFSASGVPQHLRDAMGCRCGQHLSPGGDTSGSGVTSGVTNGGTGVSHNKGTGKEEEVPSPKTSSSPREPLRARAAPPYAPHRSEAVDEPTPQPPSAAEVRARQERLAFLERMVEQAWPDLNGQGVTVAQKAMAVVPTGGVQPPLAGESFSDWLARLEVWAEQKEGAA